MSDQNLVEELQDLLKQVESHQLNQEEQEQAKAWLLDCFPDEEDKINDLTDQEIERSIRKYYEGGVKAFKASCT